VGASKPSLKSNDKEGFIRAFTDEWKDLEEVYGATLVFGVKPSDRKGVLRLYVWAAEPVDGVLPPPKVEYSCEYPTAAVESFEACLYRCLVRLERIIRDRQHFPMGKA